MTASTVLIVDDDPDMRLYVRSCLEALGPRIARVLEAADRLTALRLARSGAVDLIICDVVLPGMSGRALCEAIRVDAPPVANDDAASTDEDTPVVIYVLANDTDDDGDALTASLVTSPTNATATINPDNTVTYTPNPNFNGNDQFTYSATDPGGLSDQATVVITVEDSNVATVSVTVHPDVAIVVKPDPDTGMGGKGGHQIRSR